MSAVMLMIAMALTMKVVGWVAAERRAWDRRQWAAQEAANLMERVTGRPLRVGDGVVRRGDRPVSPGEAAASGGRAEGRGRRGRSGRRQGLEADRDPAAMA